MIELSPEWLFVVPFAGSLLVLSSWAFYCAWQARHFSARGGIKHIHRCTACGRVYVTSREAPMAPCPRCGCLNTVLRRHPPLGR